MLHPAEVVGILGNVISFGLYLFPLVQNHFSACLMLLCLSGAKMSLHKILGILGNVISFGIFLTPLPTFMTIVSKKSVEHFSPLLYLTTLISCMISVIYGLTIVHQNSVLVLIKDGVGIPIESVWIIIFWVFSPRRLRLQILEIVAVELVVVGAVLAGVFGGAHTQDKRTEIAGILSVIFNIISYASTFPILKTVIETKSVKYMPFSITFIGFLNGICWTSYSLLHFDLYILIPNGLGALLSAAQLILYFKYYRTTTRDEQEENTEMPEVATSAPDSLSCVTV